MLNPKNVILSPKFVIVQLRKPHDYWLLACVKDIKDIKKRKYNKQSRTYRITLKML